MTTGHAGGTAAPGRSPPSGWAWGVFGLLGLFLFAVATLATWKRGPAATSLGKTVTREEFRRRVLRKTPEEVRAAVRTPHETSGRPAVEWCYRGRTTDPATGQVDVIAYVTFGRDGWASEVRFY